MDKVKADKLREVTDGHDGTWIAHPGLLKIAKQARLHYSQLAAFVASICRAYADCRAASCAACCLVTSRSAASSMHACCIPHWHAEAQRRWPQVFDDNMPGPNQLSKLRQDVEVTADDLLRVPEVRSRVSLQRGQSPERNSASTGMACRQCFLEPRKLV